MSDIKIKPSKSSSNSSFTIRNGDSQKLIVDSSKNNFYTKEIERLKKESDSERLLDKYSHLLYEGIDGAKSQPKPTSNDKKEALAQKFEKLNTSMQRSLVNLKSPSSSESFTVSNSSIDSNSKSLNSRSQINKIFNLAVDAASSNAVSPSVKKSLPKQQSVDQSLFASQLSISSKPVKTLVKQQSLDSKLSSLPSITGCLRKKSLTNNVNLESNRSSPINSDSKTSLNSLKNDSASVIRVRNFKAPTKQTSLNDSIPLNNSNSKVTFTLNPDLESLENTATKINETAAQMEDAEKKLATQMRRKSSTNSLLTKESDQKLSELEKISPKNNEGVDQNGNSLSKSRKNSSKENPINNKDVNSEAKILLDDLANLIIKNKADSIKNKTKGSSKSLKGLEKEEEDETSQKSATEEKSQYGEAENGFEQEEEEEKKEEKKEKRKSSTTTKPSKTKQSSKTKNEKEGAKTEPVKVEEAPPKRSAKIFDIVGDEDFASEVLKSPRPIIVEFHSAYCGPCRMLEPKLEKLIHSFEGEIDLAKVDINYSYIASEYGVSSVPQLISFRNGQVVDRFYGLGTEQKLKEFVNQALDKK